MRRAGAAVLAAVPLAGCGDGGSGGAQESPAAAGSSAESPSADAAAEGNPVLDDDFPDPDILEVDGTYHAYATNTATLNVQVATSTDLET